MAGIPLLPGLSFSDPTKQKFGLCEIFQRCKGYIIPKSEYTGSGGDPLDTDSCKYLVHTDSVRYDPTLTYGRAREKPPPLFLPQFAVYDKKCLSFKAFFKQGVQDSPNEHFRIRQVNIIYFLENDTISVMEPKIENSGLAQGRLIKRGKIPKNERGEFFTWKDFDIGIDIPFYGHVFHTCDCDTYTREYMLSQGIKLGDPEEIPPDPYMQLREQEHMSHNIWTKTKSDDDKLRRFLEFDGKILKFDAVWDDRDSEYGELRKMSVYYFLSDDRMSVKEIHERNDGREPFPQLLRKMKMPKVWSDVPTDYAGAYLERSDADVTEYYQPKDLVVGETVYILGRKMFLYDCDKFTRNYYRKALCMEQPPRIDVGLDKKDNSMEPREMPDAPFIGSLEDSMQNIYSFTPGPPRKDVKKQILNMNKYLRYEMKMDNVHPEDEVRRFILMYSLSDGFCHILEPPIDNSGFVGGTFLRRQMLVKPNSDPKNLDYYTPLDFGYMSKIEVFCQRFIIIGADLQVYRYMKENASKFPCKMIENWRNYMYNQGFLNEDIRDQVLEDHEKLKQAKIAAMGQLTIEDTKTELDKCMDVLKAGGGEPEDIKKAKMYKLKQEYEDSLIHKYKVPPYGILPVNRSCAYPIVLGDVPKTECPEGFYETSPDGDQPFTPKHIDTPEEIREHYYTSILKRQHETCAHPVPHVCEDEPPPKGHEPVNAPRPKPTPIIVSPPEYPEETCGKKAVRFVEPPDRCARDKHDICYLKRNLDQTDCTPYKRC